MKDIAFLGSAVVVGWCFGWLLWKGANRMSRWTSDSKQRASKKYREVLRSLRDGCEVVHLSSVGDATVPCTAALSRTVGKTGALISKQERHRQHSQMHRAGQA